MLAVTESEIMVEEIIEWDSVECPYCHEIINGSEVKTHCCFELYEVLNGGF